MVTVLGVPSSAGAYCVGVERAPAALRDAGLIEALERSGATVRDAGDLTERLWRPDKEHPFAQNAAEESACVQELAGAAAELLEPGARLLVLGGSCSVAVGLCAGVRRTGSVPRLVYIDRHLDLNTPETTREGSLSWMGMAHALGLPGTVPGFADGAAPLLQPADLCYLGVDTSAATEWERSQLAGLGIPHVSQSRLVADPGAAARAARETLQAGPFVVHLDVDVLDFLDAPLAENVNGRNSGPTLEQVGEALAVLWAEPECLGLSIGQLVPAHAESDPGSLERLVAVLGAAAGAAVRAAERTGA
jgi:arginase